MFLQALPNVADNILSEVESRVRHQVSLGEAFAAGATCRELIEDTFGPVGPLILDSQPVQFKCRCTRERTRRLLALLPIEELRDLCATGPFPVTLNCRFCGGAYAFDRSELDRMVRLAEGNLENGNGGALGAGSSSESPH